MGEAKNKRGSMTAVEKIALDISRHLANQGKIILGGWAAYATVHGIDDKNPDFQKLQFAYFSGAEHLWSTFLAVLDEDKEPTDADLRRMDLIQTEVNSIRELLKLDLSKHEGNT